MTNMDWIDDSLRLATSARIAILGDFCLDSYWFIEPEAKELSVETGLPIRRVQSQRYSPGGAGNVAANVAALGVARVSAIGVVGRDPFGDKLVSLLQDLRVDTSGIYREQADWQTFVYAKPCIGVTEQNRLDFGAFNRADSETMRHIVSALQEAAESHDVIIVNQQIPDGVCSDPIIDEINALASSHPRLRIIVDTRDHTAKFKSVTLKINAAEAAKVLTGPNGLPDPIPVAKVRELADGLHARTGRPVFITRGERGIIVASNGKVEEIPGIQISPPIDSVGAGDTTVAALATILAINSDDQAAFWAARFANIAASVTVKKLNRTGTAAPDEIRAAAASAEYVYQPELAVDVRFASYVQGTEIEIVNQLPENLSIKHAIFDHDGTLSTLREGWEKIMEPMMVKAILGQWYNSADEELFSRATRECRDFIDRTTGIQTLVQMQGLVELVRNFGYVPQDQILDNHGYKQIYNESLLEMVRGRMTKLERGELSASDFHIKNAHELLDALYKKGVTLYLASGTDVEDVRAEARAMGYAHLFGERIFGAVGDVNVEAKKLVIERIIKDHNLSGAEFVTFGDGPVEIRETRKRGGLTVGIASDEVRRFGLNLSKRKRLIRAGADLIVPDYSQLNHILRVLQLN